MKRYFFLFFLLLLTMSAGSRAASKIRFYGFLSHSAPGKKLQAENWEFQKARGLNLFGAGLSLTPGLLQSNLTFFQTDYATAYDIQCGLRKNLFGLYYGKHGAITSSEKHEFLSPQYIGLSFDHSWGDLSIRIDSQYGFGTLTRVYVPIYLSHLLFSEEDQHYSLFLVAPQISYRLIRKLFLNVSIGIEKYSFMPETNLCWNVGLIFGDAYKRFFQSSRTINFDLPDVQDGAPLVRKPNIYLYPETAMQIDVSLFPQGHVTTSIPAYGDGWSVWAEPTGVLDGSYNFLFYEAQMPLTRPNAGWCVAANDLEPFFQEILHKYGFDENEIFDFLEYWLPILNEAPFYEIRPMTNETLDVICPISITPAPDNLLRLWLLFTPTDSHTELLQPTISFFDRNGFAVTEWGGALLE